MNMGKYGIDLLCPWLLLNLTLLAFPVLTEGSGSGQVGDWDEYKYDLENCEACNDFQDKDYDTFLTNECEFEKEDPEDCKDLYRKCLSSCHEGEEIYIEEMEKYLRKLPLPKKFRLKRKMSHPFTNQEHNLDMKTYIHDCAVNKLHLNDSNVPFSWNQREACRGQTNILGSMLSHNSSCRPVWSNLKDRMDFYKGCLNTYDILDFKRKGVYAARSLKSLAFELHKLEKENAQNRVNNGAAMIAGGIMAGLGVVIAPFTAGASLALTASTLTYAGSATSFGATLASLFGENPDELVRQSVEELEELKNTGNTMSALMLMYIISHRELNEFVKRTDYKKLINKQQDDIKQRTLRRIAEGANVLAQLPTNAKLSKIVAEKLFSKSSKLSSLDRISSRITTPFRKITENRLTDMATKMTSKTSAFKTLPRIFQSSKAVTFFKNSKIIKVLNRIPAAPLLASGFSIGLGVWEVFEGKKDFERGMYHHVKLAAKRTLTSTDDVIAAYLETMGIDENDGRFNEVSQKDEEEIYAVYAYVTEGNWDYYSGLYFRFYTSDGKNCKTKTKYGLKNGWLRLDTPTDLESCRKHLIKNQSLRVSVTSVQNSHLADTVTISAIEVATDGRFLPTFRTNATTFEYEIENNMAVKYSQRCTNSSGFSELISVDVTNPQNQKKLIKSKFTCINTTDLGLSASGGDASNIVQVYPIRNRLVRIKTHTSTKYGSGTDAGIRCRIGYKMNNEDEVMDGKHASSDIILDNYKNDREWDDVDIYRGDILGRIGLEDVLDSRPPGALSGQPNEEEEISISFMNDGTNLAPSWNVDLIKLYFIGEAGRQVLFVCHTGEQWIPPDTQWYKFPCKMYKPENPLRSIEQLDLKVCDKTHAGSTTSQMRLQICKNGQDFQDYSNDDFKNAVAAERCCETNYFNAENGYTRGQTTTIDGATTDDDGGEQLGQCEGFDLGSSSFSMVVQNNGSDAVCIDQAQFYGNNEKSLKSSIMDNSFRTCNIPSLWAENQKVHLEEHGDCTWRNYGHSESEIKCPLYSQIDLQSIDLGICDGYEAFEPFTLKIRDSNGTHCTTGNITSYVPNRYQTISNSVGVSNRKIKGWQLGTCRNKRMTNDLTINVKLQGTAEVCLNYFKFNDIDPKKSSLCHYSKVYADSSQVRICPEDRKYDKYPIQCIGRSGRFIQKVSLKVSDKKNSGTSEKIKFAMRNSKNQKCETPPLNPAPRGNYVEYTALGEDCARTEIADYVHIWVSTVGTNDDLYLTHFYIDVADSQGVTRSIPCMLDQKEEFFIAIQGRRNAFGIPLKCMGGDIDKKN